MKTKNLFLLAGFHLNYRHRTMRAVVCALWVLTTASAVQGAGVFTSTGSLITGRDSHTATLLPSGQVLVAGGADYDGALLASAELYDPATGFWTRIGSLATIRNNDTATLLPSGKVLVAGGEDRDNVLRSAELFDPASGAWSPIGGLGSEREVHTATLLPNGQVLVAGGIAANGNGLASAELYDPGTSSLNPFLEHLHKTYSFTKAE